MPMHPDHFQNWLDFGHGLLIFLIFIRPSLHGTYYGMAPSICPSVPPSVRLLARKNIEGISRFSNLVCRCDQVSHRLNLWFVWRYLIKYVHNYIISDFSTFGIHKVIFKLEPLNFAHFENLSGCEHKFRFLPYSIMAVLMIRLMIHLLISLGTLLARENIEGMVGFFFSNWVCRCS